MTTLIDKQFEFNLWANTEIIQICASLAEAQLSVEVPGTFGRIQLTVAHIVRAEGNYLRDLGGDIPWPNEPDWDALSLSELLDLAQQSGKLERVLAALSDGGEVLMPLDDCGFSTKFSWINDRFGLSWQLNLP